MEVRKYCPSNVLSLLSLLLFFLLYCSAPSSFATVITSERLVYHPDDGIYIAEGNVRIEKGDIAITADKLIFNEFTSVTNAEGGIIFHDKDVTITAKKAEINIDTKTGNIHDAVIFFKKDNYWIKGVSISKTGERSYYAPEASFTTCNSEPYLTPSNFPELQMQQQAGIASETPDWCFTGRNVNIEIGKNLSANNIIYHIKGLPVLYSPYILAPVLAERQSGFLMPIIGTSSKKGFLFSPAYYWAIDDDKDATFYLDYMSKRGFGKGAEFRYLDLTGIGAWQAYHLRDKRLDKDFLAFRAEDRFQFYNIKGFVSLNYINDSDFYKEYGYNLEGRITNLKGLGDVNRFFQSSAEFYFPMNNSRLYFLNQYWVDLENKKAHPIQRLPELGYILYPSRIGPLLFSISSSVSNFYSEKETRGQRLLINPSISHSFGDALKFFQSLSLMQTFYNISSSSGSDSTTHKSLFEYRANALTRFYKFYNRFVHDIELSLGYRFISSVNQPLIFDSTELLNKTSQLELSLYNSIKAKNLTAALRLTQPYNLNPISDSKNLLPTTMDVVISSQRLSMRLETAYDFNKMRTEKLNSIVSLRLSDDIAIYAAERYDKTNDINFLSAGFDKALSKRLSVGANVSYDTKGGGVRESIIRGLYKQQCWALNTVFSRKPSDSTRAAEYNFSLIFELTGVGKFRTL